MTAAIIVLAAALVGVGAGLVYWGHQHSERAAALQDALQTERRERQADQAQLDRLADIEERHMLEVAVLRGRVESLSDDLARCKDPAVVRELLREAMT